MAGKAGTSAVVRVGEREVSLTNLDKVLYPETGTTKGDCIHYYAEIAATMLPHLDGRCITLKRFPNGVETKGFFEKRCPNHRPEWVGTFLGPGDRDGEIGYCAFDEPADLVWAANMAALELHVPMARAADLDAPLILVFDFDPGPGTDIHTCCEVALWVREILAAANLDGWCKTSGSKGLQLYVPLNTPCTHEHAADFAPRRRPGAGAPAQGPGDDDDGQGRAPREDLRRLEPERPAQDDDRGVLDARPAGADGVDAGVVGRGRGVRRRRRRAALRVDATCSPGSASSVTCSPPC